MAWHGSMDLTELLDYLQTAGYQNPQTIAEQLHSLYQGRAVIGSRSRAAPPSRSADAETAHSLCHQCRQQLRLWVVWLVLIQAVLRRSAYLVLLAENPKALQQLVLLCERSCWVAQQLTAYPALLDELLDTRTLYTAPTRDLLQDQLRQQTLRLADDDLEQQMEVIRYFVRANSLRIAACDLTDVIPLMQVSDYLTWIAEVVIEHTVTIAWKHLSCSVWLPSRQ